MHLQAGKAGVTFEILCQEITIYDPLRVAVTELQTQIETEVELEVEVDQ